MCSVIAHLQASSPSFVADLQADRSGKVVIDKLRNTIKVRVPQLHYSACRLDAFPMRPCELQEFELTIDLDNLLTDLDKEQTGSIDYKEFKSLLD